MNKKTNGKENDENELKQEQETFETPGGPDMDLNESDDDKENHIAAAEDANDINSTVSIKDGIVLFDYSFYFYFFHLFCVISFFLLVIFSTAENNIFSVPTNKTKKKHKNIKKTNKKNKKCEFMMFSIKRNTTNTNKN